VLIVQKFLSDALLIRVNLDSAKQNLRISAVQYAENFNFFSFSNLFKLCKQKFVSQSLNISFKACLYVHAM